MNVFNLESIVGLIFSIIPIFFGIIMVIKRKNLSLFLAKHHKKLYAFQYDDRTIKRLYIINIISGIVAILFGLFALIHVILNSIRK